MSIGFDYSARNQDFSNAVTPLLDFVGWELVHDFTSTTSARLGGDDARETPGIGTTRRGTTPGAGLRRERDFAESRTTPGARLRRGGPRLLATRVVVGCSVNEKGCSSNLLQGQVRFCAELQLEEKPRLFSHSFIISTSFLLQFPAKHSTLCSSQWL